MDTESSIKVQVTGFAVVEKVRVEMKLSKSDKALFQTNPDQVIARLLNQAGFTVNRVTIASPIAEESDHWFHIVYPENEASGWICA